MKDYATCSKCQRIDEAVFMSKLDGAVICSKCLSMRERVFGDDERPPQQVPVQ
jgi:hypothetical protein